MARIELGGQVKYVNLKETKPGDLLVHGKYSHSKITGSFQNNTHFFRPMTDGPMVGISCGHLGWILDEYNVKKGTPLEVYYQGLSDKKIKGNRPHQVKVFVEEEVLDDEDKSSTSSTRQSDQLPLQDTPPEIPQEAATTGPLRASKATKAVRKKGILRPKVKADNFNKEELNVSGDIDLDFLQ